MIETLYIRPVTEEDKKWVKTVLSNFWGSEKIVYSGTIFDAGSLQGFIAEESNRKIGLLTYTFTQNDAGQASARKHICQIVSLNTLTPGKGIGTALIAGLQKEAKKQNCQKIIVITTNDNLKALKFYQKRGFVLTNLYVNALAASRKIKPEIPEIGEEGIPLRDELLLEKQI